MKQAPKNGASYEYRRALNSLYSSETLQKKETLPSVQTIKAAISPAVFYATELSGLKHSPKDWTLGGLCPFHADNRPGSFYVNTRTGGYTCYSCGSKGGDIVAFLIERDGLKFHEALEKLSEQWGCHEYSR